MRERMKEKERERRARIEFCPSKVLVSGAWCACGTRAFPSFLCASRVRVHSSERIFNGRVHVNARLHACGSVVDLF